ncbi:MAG: alpha/beta hydrolase, partial [Chitinophagia bacterium]|nr:alpha/beta hydrolase [Chitinophagia bacterium]
MQHSNKWKFLFLMIALAALAINVFGQPTPPYPFKVQQTGSGKAAIIFLPGFACSGEVWNDTRA